MGAPIGNQNGKGHGRPPTYQSKEEAIQLGKDLVEWIKSEEFKKAVHLSDFYLYKKDLGPKEWEAIIKRDYFRCYYEKALIAMSTQIMKNRDLAQSYGGRFLAMYEKDLHRFEEENRDRESARRSRENVLNNDDVAKKFQELRKICPSPYQKTETSEGKAS